MAYLFNRLNEVIDGPQGSARASDLLGQQAAGGRPAQQDRETLGAQNAISSQPSAIIGGAGQDRPAAPGEAATAVNSESRAKVFEKNKGAELRANTGRTTDAIAQTQADQKAAADKFVAGQTYTSNVNDESIGKAVRDDDAGSKQAIGKLLFGAQEAVDPFDYNDSSLDSFRDDVRNFNTTGGRTSLIQAGNKDGNMTQGEAGLDAALLGKSNAFRGQREDLIGRFGEASRGLADAKVRTEAVAGNNVGEQRDADKTRVRAALAKLREGTQSEDFNARVSENDARQVMNDRSRAVQSELLGAFSQRPEFANSTFAGISNKQALDRIFNDPSLAQFNTTGGQVDNFVSEQGASRFNRINELLGEGGRTAATGNLEGRGGFDEVGYRAELDRLFGGLQPDLAAIPDARSADFSPGVGVPDPGRVFGKTAGVIDGIKAAARAIDPTSKSSYTNPVTGGFNTVNDLTLKPAAKIVVEPLKKGVKAAKAVPKKLGNEGVVGPIAPPPKKKENVVEKGFSKLKDFIGF